MRVWERKPGGGGVRWPWRCFLPSRRKVSVLKPPNPSPRLHLAFSGQWGAYILQNSSSLCGNCPGSLVSSRRPKLKLSQGPAEQQPPAHAPWVPTALLTPGKPVAASRVRAHESGCLLSLPPAWGRVHVHAAFRRLHHPPPWSTASTCFHHYYAKGTRAHGAQCSQRQSLAGEQGGPASLQALYLSETPFPRVSYRDGSKDFRGQAAAGMFSSLVPWPRELLFLLLSLLLILAGRSWSCLEFLGHLVLPVPGRALLTPL